MDSQGEFSRAEMMIVTMARLLRDADNVFMGVASNLPFFSIWLAKELYNKDLTWLNIPGRVNPRPSFPPRSTVDFQLYKNGSASITLSQIFDMSARGELDIAFLSGVQVDKYGNFNLSHITEGNRLKIQFTGGAGSALLCANTKRVIFWRTRHDRRSFVEKCSVYTATGNIHSVVSPIAEFRKKDGILVLDSIFPYSNYDEVAKNTGFAVESAPFAIPPNEDELELLREFDPDGIRDIEF